MFLARRGPKAPKIILVPNLFTLVFFFGGGEGCLCVTGSIFHSNFLPVMALSP